MLAGSEIAQQISQAEGKPFQLRSSRAVPGGSINAAYLAEDGEQRYFIKLNRAEQLEMFVAEAEGLQALSAPAVIRVPRVVCYGLAGNQAFIALEYISLLGGGSDSDRRLGEQLAALHQCTGERYGWRRENTIGSTAQMNRPTDVWIDFWREQRLEFQLALAADKGYSGRLQQKGERLLDGLSALLDHDPPASLLHGDLWSGNYAFDSQGQPVIFDPAVYYGDREADMAMTELFGGFSAEFYAAYQHHFPLNEAYAVRKTLYNLYHILNHLNLFGRGYLSQAERMMDQLLAEL